MFPIMILIMLQLSILPMRIITPLRRYSWAIFTALCCCACLGCDKGPSSTTHSNASTQPRRVYALGHLQPAEGVISISALPGERLKALDPDVVENELTPANGILGVLTSYDMGKTQLGALTKKAELSDLKRNHEIEIAKAQLAQAEAGLAQAEAKQIELGLQGGKLGALEEASRLAAAEYAQLQDLSQSDLELVTAHQLAKQANQMEMANQDFRIASQSYASTQDAANKAVTAAQANIAVAKMTLEQLAQGYDKQAIEQEMIVAAETLKYSVLLAPNVPASDLQNVTDIQLAQERYADQPETCGPYTVLKIFVRPGEFITRTPIVQLADLSEMVCIAEVYEADINNLEVNQQVTLRSHAFSGIYADGKDAGGNADGTGGIQGTVERIGSLIASPGLANRNPLAPADRSVVEVRILITDPAAIAHAAKRVGLQVTVEFAAKQEKGGGSKGEE